MACQLRHGIALQGLVKQLESLSLRRLSTSSASTIGCSKHIACRSATLRMDRSHCQNLALTLFGMDKHCIGANRTEIRDKVKPPTIIETPRIVGINTTISDPISSLIKPIQTPVMDKVVVEPLSSLVPKSASKNGNKYVLNIKKKRRKRRQLEKLRERIWPVRKKLNFLRARKREIKIEEECAMYMKEAEEYDVLEVIRKDLETAKKNGYYYDNFGKNTKTFGFGDEMVYVPPPPEEVKEVVEEVIVEPLPEKSMKDLLEAKREKKKGIPT